MLWLGLFFIIAPAVTCVTTGTVVVSSGNTLKIRSAPNTDSTVLYSLYNGAKVDIVCYKIGETISGSQGTTDQWDEISSSTYGSGYGSRAYISSGSISVCSEDSGTGTVVVASGNTLHVHSAPNTGSAVLYSLNNNAVVTLTCETTGEKITGGSQGTSDEWFEINGNGYGSAAYIYNSSTPAECSSASSSSYGTDVSQPVSVSDYSCMKSNGFTYTVVRGYQQSNHVDPNAAQTIANAWNGGMDEVEVYLFPCPTCGNPEAQMDNLIDGLVGSTYGMIWLDIEGPDYWYSSTSSNIEFIQGLVNEGNARGVKLGIYTGNSQWTPITGSTTQFKAYPLWYAHYDNNPSFSDFTPFGGWTQPTRKQYEGTTSFCGGSVDLNYAADI